MRRLLAAPELAFGSAATDTHVKVVIMGVAPGRLMQNPGRAKDGLRRRLRPGGMAEQSCLEFVRTEEPLHSRMVVHDEAADEVPVASFVEPIDASGRQGETEAIEPHPATVSDRQASAVSGVEQQVDIAAGAMAAMPRMLAPVATREVSDTERVAAGKRGCDGLSGALDRPDQRGSSKARSIGGSEAFVALAPVGKGERGTEVAPIRGSDRDRLARSKWLADAGSDDRDPHDCESRDKPNHSNCMIAHGSA